MKVFLRHSLSITLLMTVIATSVISCAQIRTLTYPGNFTYLEKKEVKTLMQNMSESIERLDKLVNAAPTTDINQQERIIGELSTLESIATRLSGGHTQTNHLIISDHIEEFISDVEEAKLFASANPPNYFNAGKLTGSCLACHRFR